ncbi:MAG TPA: hypothetical protein VKP67_15300 [Xanthobacteraceae bacterium]|nr:hypothetical protein [Xanthobacteraceae bacterium]
MSPHDLILVAFAVAAGLTVYALLRWAPLLLDLLAGGGRPPPTSSARTDDESTDTPTPAVPESENNYRWARRIEADERIAEAALKKEEDAAIDALEQDNKTDEFRRTG